MNRKTGEHSMDLDADAKRKLLNRIRHGKPMGAAQWTRVFVIVGAAIELSLVNELVLREGRGSFGVLSTALVMVFIVAVAGIGLGQLEINERFAALLELLGEKQ